MLRFKSLSKMLILSSLLFVSFSLSAQNANEKPTPLIDGHEYVDLGLSVKWATCNIGATSIIQHGNLYAWGEIDTKSKYSKETYKYIQIEKVQKNLEYYLFKQIGDNISGDNRYDVAKSSWGGHWRLPSADEVKELIDNCTYEWGTLNGVTGALFTSKKNGNSIFFPAGGEELYGKGTGNELSSLLHGGGNFGSYWTGTIANGCRDLTHVNDLGFAMEVRSASASCNKNYREYGFSVRAVADMRINGHEYVDLGLPSGTKWATMNVGATTPEECGDYYAWGETTTKTSYTSDNYKWKGLTTEELVSSGVVDAVNKAGSYDKDYILTANYDVATLKWGSVWHMPTTEEIDELERHTNIKYTTQDGVDGFLFTSTINKKSIFLPVTGRWTDEGLIEKTLYRGWHRGTFWSSTLTQYQDKYSTEYSVAIWIENDDLKNIWTFANRYYGSTVRPVTSY